MPQFYEGKDILTGVIVEAHSLEFFKVAMERKKLLLRVCKSMFLLELFQRCSTRIVNKEIIQIKELFAQATLTPDSLRELDENFERMRIV